jgi:stage V sporulation protein R
MEWSRVALSKGLQVPTLRSTDLSPELVEHMNAIKARAISYGLDFFEVVFEVLPFEVMNQIAAYQGFPIRYPHWRWGMEYEKLSRRDAYGLGRIYEMVINNDPCYAYLQESNAVVDQKLVMAHVYGHADFFKHNCWFAKTDRKMMDQMANHATRVRRHIERHGQSEVERFIDDCLTIEHLIDPYAVFSPVPGARTPTRGQDLMQDERIPSGFSPDKLPAKDYMDPYINPQRELDRQRKEHAEAARAARTKFPAAPVRDVLAFLMRYAPLEDWQADVLSIVRDEAYYFSPQAMTKIMNEGWATYWHSKLMTRHFLDASEIVHYADQHSGVVHMQPGGFNPYKIGVEMFKDIERRWDKGQHGHAWEALEAVGAKEAHDDGSMQGKGKIFEVRKIYNDVTFVEEFLTPEFMDRHQMYHWKRDPQSGELKVVSRDTTKVKQALLHHITNRGQPFIYAVDANYLNRGELYLAHQWTGMEIELAKVAPVLQALRRIWGRPVHLQARVNDDQWLHTMADSATAPGKPAESSLKRERITDETPKPAHVL